MKNLVMKLRKSEGYVGVETMVIAGLVVAAGLIAMDVVLNTMKDGATLAHGDLKAVNMDGFTAAPSVTP